MDHRRPLHQPAAPNKLICGRTWLVFEAKPSGKDRRHTSCGGIKLDQWRLADTPLDKSQCSALRHRPRCANDTVFPRSNREKFATLRSNFSCVTIAPHENQNQKRNLLQFDANKSEGMLNATRANADGSRWGVGRLHLLLSDSERRWTAGLPCQDRRRQHTGGVGAVSAEMVCDRVDGPRPHQRRRRRRWCHHSSSCLDWRFSPAKRHLIVSAFAPEPAIER
jgi:hypothetical protein